MTNKDGYQRFHSPELDFWVFSKFSNVQCNLTSLYVANIHVYLILETYQEKSLILVSNIQAGSQWKHPLKQKMILCHWMFPIVGTYDLMHSVLTNPHQWLQLKVGLLIIKVTRPLPQIPVSPLSVTKLTLKEPAKRVTNKKNTLWHRWSLFKKSDSYLISEWTIPIRNGVELIIVSYILSCGTPLFTVSVLNILGIITVIFGNWIGQWIRLGMSFSIQFLCSSLR